MHQQRMYLTSEFIQPKSGSACDETIKSIIVNWSFSDLEQSLRNFLLSVNRTVESESYSQKLAAGL